MRLVVSTVIIFLIINSAEAQQSGGITGKTAPEWKVSKWEQLPEGKKSLSPADFKGKVIYLYFFQSWCPGCHKLGFPTLAEVRKHFADKPNIEFVAIQTTFEGHKINTSEKLGEIAERYQLETIPFGHTTGHFGLPEIMRKYNSRGTPWTVIIDPQGIVKYNNFHIKPEEAISLISKLAGS